jgi:hypothetical protein
MLCLHQGDSVPTPTKCPIPISDVIADILPQGHSLSLARLLQQSPNDTANGHRPLPWLTPSLVREGGNIVLICSGNVRFVKHNNIISFCPGALIDGNPRPFVMAAGEVTSPMCPSITISIACPKVFHNVLHTGSNSARDFGLHTFPKSVLQHLEVAEDASWMASFRPLAQTHFGTTFPAPLPKNLSIRFGAH